jgi:TPR repeat protein
VSAKSLAIRIATLLIAGSIPAVTAGAQRTEEERFRDYLRGCDDDNVPLKCAMVGRAYANGKGVDKDLSLAVSYYLQACDGGWAHSCGSAGFAYLYGEGVIQNRAHATKYYRRACDLGASYLCQQAAELERPPASPRLLPGVP